MQPKKGTRAWTTGAGISPVSATMDLLRRDAFSRYIDSFGQSLQMALHVVEGRRAVIALLREGRDL